MCAPNRFDYGEGDASPETPHGVPRGASLQWRPHLRGWEDYAALYEVIDPETW
jgi:hypothetical protein